MTRLLTAALLLAVLPTAGAAPALVAQVVADPCPAAFPVAELVAGAEVSGLTVEKGTAPEPFTASVIGVIAGGIAPGFDMILAEATSPAIDRAGGIWAGMSGSPVYAADGRLVGAVAYGLSFGPSPVAGITPAAEMRKLLNDGGAVAAAPEVDLPPALAKAVVASGAATSRQVAGGLAPLPTPVGVSGLSSTRLARVTERIQDAVPGARVYAAAPAPGTAGAHDLVPGGNVGAALSYGDFTAAGVGTVTAVCGDEALLFGHPLAFSGRTSLSAHGAEALYVQGDSVFGPFKVANLGGIAGTVDQDRLAGLHTQVGPQPPATPVTSDLTATGTGVSRQGTTAVVDPGFVPDGAAIHLLVNLDRVADRIGGGVAQLAWEATGTRAGGVPWRLSRQEMTADTFDVAFPAIFDVFGPLAQIQSNPWEEVSIDSVSAQGTVSDTYRSLSVVGLQVRDPAGRWRTVGGDEPVAVVAGARAQLRAVLRPYRSTTTTTAQVSVSVPSGWAGAVGFLSVAGGGDFFEDDFAEPADDGDQDAGDLDALLARLRDEPPGNSLVAQLQLERETAQGTLTRRRTGRATTPDVVTGSAGVPVEVVAPRGARPGTVSGGRNWALRRSLSGGPPAYTLAFGDTSFQPVMGDWNGNGIATPGVFRDGRWFLRDAVTRTATRAVTFGQAGDRAVVGDWDGDGRDDLGVFRAGRFLLRDSTTSGEPTHEFDFGAPGDLPVAGDWDGDGDDTVGTFSRGAWRVRDRLSSGPPHRQATFGQLAGDLPVVGDWNASGSSGIGVYRGGRWLLRQTVSNGSPQLSFTFGTPSARPVVWR